MIDDPQRERLYRAEDEALARFGPRFAAWDDLVAWVDAVTTHPSWSDSFDDPPVEVRVRPRPRSARWSLAEPAAAAIHLREGSWDGPTVLHELAHLVADDADGHGPRFAGVLLELVRRFLGFHAYGALLADFERHGVVWVPPGCPTVPVPPTMSAHHPDPGGAHVPPPLRQRRGRRRPAPSR